MEGNIPCLDFASWSTFNGWNISDWDEPWYGGEIVAWCKPPAILDGAGQHQTSRPEFNGIFLAIELSEHTCWEDEIVVAKYYRSEKKWTFNGYDREDWEIRKICRVMPPTCGLVKDTTWYKQFRLKF